MLSRLQGSAPATRRLESRDDVAPADTIRAIVTHLQQGGPIAPAQVELLFARWRAVPRAARERLLPLLKSRAFQNPELAPLRAALVVTQERAFVSLPSGERQQLLDVLYDARDSRAGYLRRRLAETLRSRRWQGSSAAEQRALLRELVVEAPFGIEKELGAPVGASRQFEASSFKRVEQSRRFATNEHEPHAALSYRLVVDGHRIQVTYPRHNTVHAKQPRPYLRRDLDMAIARLPAEELPWVGSVIVEPYKDDPTDGFETASQQMVFMQREAELHDRQIHIFPGRWPKIRNSVQHLLPAQNWAEISATMIHEIGHLRQARAWGVPPDEGALPPAWQKWANAMKKDARSVSGYGDTEIAEDAAEAYMLYRLTLNSPDHDRYRQRYPRRFRLLDALVAETGG